MCPLGSPHHAPKEGMEILPEALAVQAVKAVPELNQHHAAFVISPTITACYPCLLPNPCSLRGFKYCSEKKNPAGGLKSYTQDHQFLLASSPAKWPPPTHSSIFCVWLLLGVSDNIFLPARKHVSAAAQVPIPPHYKGVQSLEELAYRRE